MSGPAGNVTEGDSSVLDEFPRLSNKNIESNRNGHSNSQNHNGKEKKRVNTGVANLPILQRKIIHIKEDYNRTELFGNPLLVSFPSATTTYATIYDLVKAKVSHYLDFDQNPEVILFIYKSN